MKKKVCPDCGNDRFNVTGIERHDWVVDGNGHFITSNGCYEAEIADQTIWECTECKAEFDGPEKLLEV